MKLHATCIMKRPGCHGLLSIVPVLGKVAQGFVSVSCNEQAQITPKTKTLVGKAFQVWGENHNDAIVHV